MKGDFMLFRDFLLQIITSVSTGESYESIHVLLLDFAYLISMDNLILLTITLKTKGTQKMEFAHMQHENHQKPF
jgi:hypothetical protein